MLFLFFFFFNIGRSWTFLFLLTVYCLYPYHCLINSDNIHSYSSLILPFSLERKLLSSYISVHYLTMLYAIYYFFWYRRQGHVNFVSVVTKSSSKLRLPCTQTNILLSEFVNIKSVTLVRPIYLIIIKAYSHTSGNRFMSSTFLLIPVRNVFSITWTTSFKVCCKTSTLHTWDSSYMGRFQSSIRNAKPIYTTFLNFLFLLNGAINKFLLINVVPSEPSIFSRNKYSWEERSQ